MSEEEYIGSKLFDKIETDDRVTRDLNHCLYCVVTSHNPNGSMSNIEYRIPLNCINGADFKQCPACKRIYILKDPI